jgi:hypothetical protein
MYIVQNCFRASARSPARSSRTFRAHVDLAAAHDQHSGFHQLVDVLFGLAAMLGVLDLVHQQRFFSIHLWPEYAIKAVASRIFFCDRPIRFGMWRLAVAGKPRGQPKRDGHTNVTWLVASKYCKRLAGGQQPAPASFAVASAIGAGAV